MNKKIAEMITNTIVSRLEDMIENGEQSKWKRPWIGSNLPVNYLNRKQYRGINLLMLSGLGDEFITFNQIKTLQEQKKYQDIKLKKGSKSIPILYWNWIEKEEKNEGTGEIEKVNIPFVKYYKVFNCEDVENLPSLFEVAEFEHQDVRNDIKQMAERIGVKVNSDKKSGRAFYNANSDMITVPKVEQYENESEFQSTLAHEAIHSTGHKNRLNRFTSDSQFMFGSDSYSEEELVAEIGSALLLAELGIDSSDTFDNSVHYLKSWLKKLKDDTTLIIRASQQAQKACDLLLGTNEEEM